MKKFHLDDDIVKLMAQRPRAVQVEIARRANRKLGVESAHLQGIAKFEGGVIVGNREITIQTDFVIDDMQSQKVATPEEISVVRSIMEIQRAFRKNHDFLCDAPEAISGDPLREMLHL